MPAWVLLRFWTGVQGLAGEESTELESRLVNAVMLPSQRREVEMRLEEPGSR